MLFKPMMLKGQLSWFFPLPLHQRIFLELIIEVLITQLDISHSASALTPPAWGFSSLIHWTVRTLGRGQSSQPSGLGFLVEAAQSGRVVLGGIGW